MSYRFERHNIEEFIITNVWTNFMRYDRFYSVRKDITKCDLCETDFKPDSTLNLAFVQDKKNMLICTTCATKAIDGGADERVFGRNIDHKE
jgi:hypothetical protein